MTTLVDAHRQLIAKWITAHRDSLLVFFLSKGLQPADAEDLAQNVFVRTMQWAQRNNNMPHQPEAWLRRTAKNQLIDYWKKRQLRCNTIDQSLVVNHSDTSAASSCRPCNEFADETVKTTVDSLPSQQRDVVKCWMQGFTHKEIATRMQICQRTSQRLLISAKERLRERLQSTQSE